MTADIQNPNVSGKYNLLKKIAVGGMAEIFLAEQTGPGGFKKRLVIKRILEHLGGDNKFLEMFQDEARLAAGLNHPNIVQIFELGQDHGTYYIAMEYVHGYNLRSVIQNCNEHSMWLAPEYIAKLGSQICEGLEYAHNFCDSTGKHLNIIHRDVSPQNIILSNQGIIKIVDFGIAKAESNMVKTQAGVIKGKLAYMSPEQVKGQQLDRRSDLFSLGIVLYELATHVRPFQGKSDLDILRAILENKPTPIEHFRPEFPPELAQIVYRSLAKNREERYSSARDLQWDLERFIQNWGKPIGPFQLQQLVTKLEELTTASSPSEPLFSPGVAEEADLDFEDDLDSEETIYNSGAPGQGQPYGTGNYPPPQAAAYPPPANHAPGGWGGNQWDDEDEATVMSPSPVLGSPSQFRHLANANPTDHTGEKLNTIHEASNHPPLPSAPTMIEGQIPAGIHGYLSPPPANISGTATMIDRDVPIPRGHSSMEQYLQPPPKPAPPVASPRIPGQQQIHHSQPIPTNGAHNRSAMNPPANSAMNSKESSAMEAYTPVSMPPKKGSRWALGIGLGVFVGLCIFVAFYFLVISS